MSKDVRHLDRVRAAGDPIGVLVVEDDETDRCRLVKFARRAGLEAEFHEAEDLGALQAQIDARRFDLIYVDYHLGLATGDEALDLIFAHPGQAGALVMMVTSIDKPDTVARLIRAGCADFLLKEQLGPEAVGKSVVTAFERLLHLSALDGNDRRRAALFQMLGRFRTSMAPRLRQMMEAMLSRTIRFLESGDEDGTLSRTMLQQTCADYIRFLDETEPRPATPDGARLGEGRVA